MCWWFGECGCEEEKKKKEQRGSLKELRQGRPALERGFQDHGQLHAAASVLLKPAAPRAFVFASVQTNLFLFKSKSNFLAERMWDKQNSRSLRSSWCATTWFQTITSCIYFIFFFRHHQQENAAVFVLIVLFSLSVLPGIHFKPLQFSSKQLPLHFFFQKGCALLTLSPTEQLPSCRAAIPTPWHWDKTGENCAILTFKGESELHTKSG